MYFVHVCGSVRGPVCVLARMCLGAAVALATFAQQCRCEGSLRMVPWQEGALTSTQHDPKARASHPSLLMLPQTPPSCAGARGHGEEQHSQQLDVRERP